MKTATTRLKFRYEQGVETKVHQLVAQHVSKANRAIASDTLSSDPFTVSVKPNFSRTSLIVSITGNNLIETEFGTLKTPARPWFRKMQTDLAPRLKSLVVKSISLKI